MPRIFIIQPQEHKTDDEIIQQREIAVENVMSRFKDRNVRFLNSFENLMSCPVDKLNDVVNKKVHMIGSLTQELAYADYIYLCPGWSKSVTCRILYKTAKLNGIEEIHYQEFGEG